MTAGLIIWLRAQLDQDERIAQAASAGPWTADPPGKFQDPFQDPDDIPVYDATGNAICCSPDDFVRGGHSAADAEHITTWNPARVLTEIKAKRAVLDALVIALTCDEANNLEYAAWLNGENPPNVERPHITGRIKGLQHAAQLLAQAYAGRVGWKPEWSMTT